MLCVLRITWRCITHGALIHHSRRDFLVEADVVVGEALDDVEHSGVAGAVLRVVQVLMYKGGKAASEGNLGQQQAQRSVILHRGMAQCR